MALKIRLLINFFTYIKLEKKNQFNSKQKCAGNDGKHIVKILRHFHSHVILIFNYINFILIQVYLPMINVYRCTDRQMKVVNIKKEIKVPS